MKLRKIINEEIKKLNEEPYDNYDKYAKNFLGIIDKYIKNVYSHEVSISKKNSIYNTDERIYDFKQSEEIGSIVIQLPINDINSQQDYMIGSVKHWYVGSLINSFKLELSDLKKPKKIINLIERWLKKAKKYYS